MCGIAGIVDLAGGSLEYDSRLDRMLDTIIHRGPDNRGRFVKNNLAMGCQRLQIVGIDAASQPVRNEDDTIVAVVNGEFYDHLEIRGALIRRGHRLRCDADSEILVHQWEDHKFDFFSTVRGQFAFALLDRQQQSLVLARDRVGICPLHWTLQGNHFLFCSEIKGILAALDQSPTANIRGIDQIFSFFSLPGQRTCFENIHSLPPGSYLTLPLQSKLDLAKPQVTRYWDIAFPDRGDERDGRQQTLIDEFGEVFDRAVSRRLVTDQPLATYLSGGVDSTIIRQRANALAGNVIPCYTANVTAARKKPNPLYSEFDEAQQSAKATGNAQKFVECNSQDIADHYPQLIKAAESPGSRYGLQRFISTRAPSPR